jgi:hypothetical protein
MRELPADRAGRFELTLPTAGARARLALQLSLLLAWVALVGCPAGGGGGTMVPDDGMLPDGPAVSFTPDNPSPGVGTISMAAGATDGTEFEVRILVTGIDDFFGAAFRVTFDPSIVDYNGFSSGGSFIEGAGITTDFRAELDSGNPGVILVNATRQGQVAGVDAVDSQELLVLSFEASGPGVGALSFDRAATRQVSVCPSPTGACTDLADSSLTWSGGTLVAN